MKYVFPHIYTFLYPNWAPFLPLPCVACITKMSLSDIACQSTNVLHVMHKKCCYYPVMIHIFRDVA